MRVLPEAMDGGGVLSHGVFDCESLEQVPQLSYSKFGPSSYASIDYNANNWFDINSQMSSNPYSEKVNGKGHIVRLACLATILGVYEGRGHSIEDDDHSKRCADWLLNWKECLVKYKSSRKSFRRRNAERPSV